MKKFNSFIFSLVLMLAVAVSSYASDGVGIGEQVSDFTITNYDGNTYTLSQNGANATVVVFMSTECPFVQPYTDRLNALTNEFSSQGIVIWGINSNKTESTDEVQSHATEKGYSFPMLKDNNNVVADQFNAQRTPEVFVIDNSTMTVVYHGSIDDDKVADNVSNQYLKTALTQFLNGEAIANAETKAFGCTIKR